MEDPSEEECSTEISNDAPNRCKFPLRYAASCEEPNDDNLVHTTVGFDYEVHYTSRNPPLQRVEGLLLEHLAILLDLQECEEESSRRLSWQEQIVEIRSEPRDESSWGIPCVAPVEKSIFDIAECRRIHGSVTATLHSDAALLETQSSLLREIRSAMQENDLLQPGEVERLIFMGQRIEESAPVIPPEDSSSLSGAAMAGWSLASVALVIFAIGLLARRRRKVERRVPKVVHDLEAMETTETVPNEIPTKEIPVKEIPCIVEDTAEQTEEQHELQELQADGMTRVQTSPTLSTCQTLDSLSEPTPMDSWVDDDEEEKHPPTILEDEHIQWQEPRGMDEIEYRENDRVENDRVVDAV